MEGWHTYKIKEIAARKRWALNGGPFGSKLTTKDYIDSGVPVIRGVNLPENTRFSTEEFVWVSEEKANELLANNAHPGDLVFTQRGTIGQVGLIPRDTSYQRFVISQSQMKLTPDAEIADELFLYYVFTSNVMVKAIQNLAFSSGVPHINLDILRKFEIELPPLHLQHHIASILSAYDDLIENCQRRIHILEDMARSFYREWFVKFRFPGHEKVRMVRSPLGDIPEGWEVRKLKDMCRLTMGQSPRSEFYNELGNGLPFHQGVTDFGDRFPSDRLFCTAGSRIAERGDILFSVRAPVGRMNIANKKIILGRGLSAIRHNDDSQAFLWEQLRNHFIKDDMIGNGAIFASVTKDDMQRIELLCPPQSVVELATKYLDPIHSKITTLSQQKKNLSHTRDLLLPRLMSGQIVLSYERE